MLGDYVLHFPLTDFAVSLLALAALIDVGRLVLKRESWSTAVDLLLVTGFLGALAAVGSGLWLVSSQAHAHDHLLSMHHWFAYGTLAAASASVVARLLEKRARLFSAIKTGTLVLAAALVSGAGFYGGKMAHPAGEAGHHDAMPHDDAVPHPDVAPHESMTLEPQGAIAPVDAASALPADTVTTPSDAAKPAVPSTPDHDSKPHSH